MGHTTVSCFLVIVGSISRHVSTLLLESGRIVSELSATDSIG